MEFLFFLQVLFVHPNALPCPLAEGISSGVVDFLCDSSRTVASMVSTRDASALPSLLK